MKRIVPLLIVCCLRLLFASSTCFAQMYTITDLGTLGGSWSAATGINASGQVVGTSEVLDPVWGSLWHAFRTSPNSPINPTTDDLNTVPCNNFYRGDICIAAATGINNSGQVVGKFRIYSADDLPFRMAATDRSLTVGDQMGLATAGGATFEEGTAYAINNSGQTVGEGNFSRAFRVDANSQFAGYVLGTIDPTGRCCSAAYGINDSGQVVGSSNGHAFRTAPNSPINPATDDLGPSSSATGINAFGQVVGWASTTDGAAFYAFRTGPNAAINPATDDLGTLGGSLSLATSINNFGQVVGWSSLTADTTQHAFLYDGGVMRDPNNLIPAGFSCTLAVVPVPFPGGDSPDINDAGQIAANVSCNGQPHAVRLDPIYKALVKPPINADGSSVFNAKRGVVPVKFVLTQSNITSCTLSPATIAVTRTAGGVLGSIDEGEYSMAADNGSNFRISGCQYIYNLAASSMGVGTYRVDISIQGIMVGHAGFALK